MNGLTIPSLAIAVQQPWAFFLVAGLKNVENRTWALPVDHVDKWLLIHASAKPAFNLDEAKDILGEVHGAPWTAELPLHGRKTGGIVGMVRFGRSLQGSTSPWADSLADTWHWPVLEALLLPFRPCKGQLGFFKVDYASLRAKAQRKLL